MPVQNEQHRSSAISREVPEAEFGIHRVNYGFNDNR
jgi:hypothetical protein